MKVEKAKDTGVIEFKESISYWMAISYVVVEFLVKKKIKMRRIQRKAHNIEDLSFLDNINIKPTFFDNDRDTEEEGKEVV